MNTILPDFTEKNQFHKIKEIDGLLKYQHYSTTNLTKKIINLMLTCISFIKGYSPSLAILSMLKIRKIVTGSYEIDYYNRDELIEGKYGSIDLRYECSDYKPPKEIEIRDDMDK